MGRYYYGDISGKFGVIVQPSNDADNFGFKGVLQNYLEYIFNVSDLPNIKREIDKCRDELGEYDKKIGEYLKRNDGYCNDRELMELLGVPISKERKMLALRARKALGEKIYRCVKKKKYCHFLAGL